MFPALAKDKSNTHDNGFKKDTATTDEFLAELCKFGEPRTSKMQRGWHASMDVFVSGKGVEFQVKTPYDVKTPLDAVRICYERLIKAVLEIKETV